MRETRRLDLSRFFVLSWITVIALVLPNLTVNNAFASATPSIKKQLDIAVGQTAKFDFSMKKDEPIGISITGLSQESESGFKGQCVLYTSAGVLVSENFLAVTIEFKNDDVSVRVVSSKTDGSYFLNCLNQSTKEAAKIVITAVSFESIASPNNGEINIPGMESALFNVKMTKDIPWFLTILGSGKTTAKGFVGRCLVYTSAGVLVGENFLAVTIEFKNNSGKSRNFYPSYSGNLIFFCSNYSREQAVLTLGIHSTASIQRETVSKISIAPSDFAFLRFTAQKGQPLSISTKGNPKKTTSGFGGYCTLYDENAKLVSSNSSMFLAWQMSFEADKVSAEIIKPSYTGFYYLECQNRGNEAAIFEVFGLTELKQIAMTSDFLIAGEGSTTTKASSSPKPSVSSTPKPSPSPSLSGTTGQGDVSTATNLTIEAQGSIKKIETGNFTFADIQRALDAANKAVETANKALKAASSADANSSKAQSTAQDALEEAKKVQQLAKSLESANKSISNLKSAVGAITNTVNAMTIESACRDSKTKLSAGLSITGDVFGSIPTVGDILALPFSIGSSLNDIKAIEKCKGK